MHPLAIEIERRTWVSRDVYRAGVQSRRSNGKSRRYIRCPGHCAD